MEDIKIPTIPTHAAYINDNYCGDHDKYFIFAFKEGEILYSYETGAPLLKYVGDEILRLWELDLNEG